MVDKKKGVDPVDEVEKRTLYLVKDEGRPIPSNEWFQNLIFKQYGTGLWAMPHRVDATPEGIEIFHSTTFSGDGVRAIAEWPLAELGRVDWTAHGSTPTSMVYANAAKKTRTLIAWNPTAQPQTVQFFEGIKPIGKLAVAPRSIASASLAP